jgi:hypothetical protein
MRIHIGLDMEASGNKLNQNWRITSIDFKRIVGKSLIPC